MSRRRLAAVVNGSDALPLSVPVVESVRRAARILGCFRDDRPELGVSEIARQLQMHKSTVHRLLATLEVEGFVRRLDGSRYTLGWKLFELGALVPGWAGIRQAVLDVLEALATETGETAHLAVLDQAQVLYVEKVESHNRLRMPSAVGKRVPVHCTALGKILVAGLSDGEVQAVLAQTPLERFTPNTIGDARRFREELRQVRKQGFALDREELEEGLMCVGGPVTDDTGIICAALSISGPASRTLAHLDDHVARVRAAGKSLSAQLGSRARRLRDAGTVLPAASAIPGGSWNRH